MITQNTNNNVFLQRLVARVLIEENLDVIIADFLKYILRTFSRMRGKDLVRQIMGKKSPSLSFHTRQKVAAKSDQFNYRSTKKEIDENDEEMIDSDIGNNEISEQDHQE
mmetsp:Transcript_15331/g.30565  ORF Transcript_15331/g.30565 Transcript_15331/m.30565 type:complete len:109 (-) Transcript_15331:319-645(-)